MVQTVQLISLGVFVFSVFLRKFFMFCYKRCIFCVAILIILRFDADLFCRLRMNNVAATYFLGSNMGQKYSICLVAMFVFAIFSGIL